MGMYYKRKNNGILGFNPLNGEYYFQTEEGLNNQSKIAPVSVCWLIESNCNLDCIYCFSEHKNQSGKTEKFLQAADNILSLEPLTIVLTGGEPTLNKSIKDILQHIGTEAFIIVDSNGTTNNWQELIPYLKNSLVRFSIDSLNEDIIQKVRPSKNPTVTLKQIETITRNIQLLKNHNITVIIQTVMTKHNLGELEEIYEYLLQQGIYRWYISAVKYSEKCKDDYNEIRLSESEISDISDRINSVFTSSDLNITLSLEEDAGAKAGLFVEESGKFFVDSINNGILYVGNDSKKPTQEEVCESLDIQKHYDLYINKKNIISYNNGSVLKR